MTRRALCRCVSALVLTVTLGALPLGAQEAKSLDWTAFVVDARLDSTGTLFVRERQTILFTGDWNGGERRFDLRSGQRFWFNRIARIDSLTGAEVPMREGDLDMVDGYRLTDNRTLRWRSRLPGDPPFLNTKITYVIEYAYSDILLAEGSAYRLDHEFAFRDRVGTIANFELNLQVDAPWRTPATFTGQFRQAVLEPGVSYVVNIPLGWRGAGVPSAVRRSPPAPLRLGLAGALLVVLVTMIVTFTRREAVLGRFAPLTPRQAIDRAWLQARILSLQPELVGYAWDEQVGAAEVSAVLARMVNEKKLASRVEKVGWKMFTRPVLHLELLVPRGDLQGYERSLVDAFFASGKTTTSTDDLRERYKRTGFDPASLIRTRLTDLFTKTFSAEPPATSKRRRWPLTLGLLVAGIGLFVAAISTRSGDAQVALVGVLVIGMPVFLMARLQSYL